MKTNRSMLCDRRLGGALHAPLQLRAFGQEAFRDRHAGYSLCPPQRATPMLTAQRAY
jgi:hypothetical protein